MRPGRIGDNEHVGGAKGVKERFPAGLEVGLEGVAVRSGLSGAAPAVRQNELVAEGQAYEAVVLVYHDASDAVGPEASPVEAGDVCQGRGELGTGGG